MVGSLAAAPPHGGLALDGLLVKKDFSYTLMAASHLHDATSLAVTSLLQRPCFRSLAPLPPLLRALRGLFSLLDALPPPPAAGATLPPVTDTAGAAGGSDAAFSAAAAPQLKGGVGPSSIAASSSSAADAAATASVEVEAPAAAEYLQAWCIAHVLTMVHDPLLQLIHLEWAAGPVADMVADAVTATLLQLQATSAPSAAPPPAPSPALPPAPPPAPPPVLVGGGGGGGGEVKQAITVKLEDSAALFPSSTTDAPSSTTDATSPSEAASAAVAAAAAAGPTPGEPSEDDGSHAFFTSSKKART